MASHLSRIAIVGAAGRIGGAFTRSLLGTGKHTVTAITRKGSKSVLPEGVTVRQVDYEDQSSIVSALKDQQFLIITLSVTAPPDTHSKLLQAAAKAGVPYVMPNAYGTDIQNEKLVTEQLHGKGSLNMISELKSLGLSYVVLVCGHWYEWSLSLGEQWYGIDIKKRTATFVDDGKTMVNSSTWAQCGRAVAAMLSLPEKGPSPSLADYIGKEKPLYISSFRLSQRDMLDSVERVTGTTDKDWDIKHEDHQQRYQDGLNELKQGIRTGFAKAMYTRHFYPNGDGDYETSRGLANDVLGLPTEDLDSITKVAVEMSSSGYNPLAGHTE